MVDCFGSLHLVTVEVDSLSKNLQISPQTEIWLLSGFCFKIEAKPVEVTSYVHPPAKEHKTLEELSVMTISFNRIFSVEAYTWTSLLVN